MQYNVCKLLDHTPSLAVMLKFQLKTHRILRYGPKLADTYTIKLSLSTPYYCLHLNPTFSHLNVDKWRFISPTTDNQSNVHCKHVHVLLNDVEIIKCCYVTNGLPGIYHHSNIIGERLNKSIGENPRNYW